LISLAALLLAFTAINKIWAFAELGTSMTPFVASLLVGLITLVFTAFGGIRTSIFTGSLQTILWITFITVALIFTAASTDLVNLKGKNELDTVWNEKFLTSFLTESNVNIIGNGGFSRAIQYTLKKMNIEYKIYERADVDKIDKQHNEIFINATPIDIESRRNKIIDLRPHTEHGKIVAKFQAIDQFKLYTGIDYEES
jgi:hypothetical protein